MMSFQGIGINLGDEYYTPKYIVDYFGTFDYDPATTEEKANEFGIKYFDTIKTDGLSKDWTPYRRIWLNPPFTSKYLFLEKAYDTFKKSHSDIFVVMPITALTTKKYHDLKITAKLFIPNKRINFERNNGVTKSSPSAGSVILKLQEKNEITYFDFSLLKDRVYDQL